jgi:hypothetical protein
MLTTNASNIAQLKRAAREAHQRVADASTAVPPLAPDQMLEVWERAHFAWVALEEAKALATRQAFLSQSPKIRPHSPSAPDAAEVTPRLPDWLHGSRRRGEVRTSAKIPMAAEAADTSPLRCASPPRCGTEPR